MEKNYVDLKLLISDFEDITHDELSRLLAINPCYIQLKGEKRNPKNPSSPLWQSNIWSMNSGLDKYASFEDQMNKILDIIESKMEVFKPLCQKYYCEFVCAVFTYKDNEESTPWIHLNKRYNKVAAALNLEFDIDLYAW